MQGALRFDHPWSTYPEQSIGGVEFLPAATTFPETRGVEGCSDFTPRMGLAYDLLGTVARHLPPSASTYLSLAGGSRWITRTTLGKSRVRESRTLGFVGVKPNGLATPTIPHVHA